MKLTNYYEDINSGKLVSKQSISSDIAYLREQAKGTIKEYVTEYLPYK
jgi:hypothetical protein